MPQYYSSRSIPTTQHSSSSRLQGGQLQSERSQGRYTTSHHHRDDFGYRSSRYETEDEDSSGAEAHTYSTRRSEHRRVRSTGSGSYGGSISQLQTEPLDREHDMRYYNYTHEEESPTGTSHGHGKRRSELEGRYSYSERIPAPTSERERARVMQPAPRITVSEYDGLEYGYTYPASSSVRHESQRHPEQYPRQTPAYQDPYRSRTSSQYYSPSISNSPSAGGAYPLRRVPSNQSDRYSVSPPSPTAYPEGVQMQPVQVNRYGRVPLWYEEREAFTRYSS